MKNPYGRNGNTTDKQKQEIVRLHLEGNGYRTIRTITGIHNERVRYWINRYKEGKLIYKGE